ncbi:MAG: sensor histidine kinase [Candidatus Marinimicrobia bacterium]|nr:sensor histidine kinase [Candidatus Neomarinimicrobiota bacterium]
MFVYFSLDMGSQIDRYFLKHYLPRESETYFQGKVLLFTHLSIIGLMAIILSITMGGFTAKLLLTTILFTSLILILLIANGNLYTAILLSYSGIGFFASMLIFSRESYVNFEVYALVAIHMFITLVASLLTKQRFHTHLTTITGVIYLTLLLLIRGLRLATSENPLELDDYFIGIVLLILTGFITRNTLDRRKRLLDISESESDKNLTQTLELKQSVKEKELLLHEVHHRVKNNLNVAISLQRMQIRNLDLSNEAIDALQESIGRLNSMALVHERLYAV